jgi:hypothetical protein
LPRCYQKHFANQRAPQFFIAFRAVAQQ